MKRSLFAAGCAILIAACGAEAPTPLAGHVEVLGPDANGEFYVVGLSGTAQAGSLVSIQGTPSATAKHDGSFATLAWGEIDGSFLVEFGNTVVTTSAMSPEKVNVNTASAKGLEALPGLGEVKAASVTANRAQFGLFAELSDLERVTGIGPATVERISEYAEIDINVNAAPKTHLMALPTIGDVRAEAIIAWRETYGAFTSPEELIYVPGIGPGEFAAVRDFITIGDPPSGFPGSDLVNVNTAGVDTLDSLPGIGPARAAAIVDWRETQGLFQAKANLLLVPGIGTSTYDKIRDRITVGVLDLNEGMFLGDASWSLAYNGTTTDSGLAQDLVVTSHYGLSSDELVLTFVGGGACVKADPCAPVALKGLLDDADDGTFGLLGFLVAGDGGGSFTIGYTPTNGGTLTEDGLTLSFDALRGVETYNLNLSAGRVLQ